MRIVLLGYMASGKSTIGRLLAKKMNVAFIDLDTYITEKEGATIKELFSTKGEIYFRKQEAYYLKEVLAIKEGFILALGGGTPCYGTNMEIIKNSNTRTIYLKASINELVGRLKQNKEKRPLIANLDNEQLAEYIGKHIFERAQFYEQSNDRFLVDGKSVNDIIEQLEVLLY